MATLNRKERRAQRNESNTIGILLRLFFGLSFIGLAVVLFGEFDYNFIFSIFTADIVVSLIYVMMNRSRITTSLAVHTNVRVIIAFLIMLITMFFYAFALWRADHASHIIHRRRHRISSRLQLYKNDAYQSKLIQSFITTITKRHIPY